LKVCRAEYDNLLESSPNIDLDIITMFNKKFEDKYPNVRKPIICNGLKAIVPYKHPIVQTRSVETIQEEDETQEVVEPSIQVEEENNQDEENQNANP
jgi:hypothetical protein